MDEKADPHDKSLVRGGILIDDKPEINGAHVPARKHLMFDQDYNRHIEPRTG
ncbi:MAG: 5' nucleotidase, NT5C type [Actinomycetota bacterium]